MAWGAVRKLRKVIDNVRRILAVEYVAAARAVDLRRPLEPAAASAAVISVVRRRVDETGVSEPTIQQQGAERIIVQMPGIDDPERIKRLLGTTAKLTFHMVNEEASVTDAVDRGNVPLGSQVFYEDDAGTRIPYVVFDEVVVSGERLVDAQATFQDGQPIVSFRFDAAGGQHR